MRALGDLAREEEAPHAGDPRWEALARGELSAEEVAALRAETSPGAKEALEAFAPLDEAEIARLAAGAEASLLASRPGATGAATPQPKRPAENVVPIAASARARPRARTGWLAAATAAVALAAGAALLLRGPAVDLPRYELTVSGGDQDLRSSSSGGAADAARLHPGSALDVIARPSRGVDRPVEARAFLAREGRLEPVAASPVRSPDGAFRLRGTRESLFPGAAPGPVELVIAVGPAGSLPRAPATRGDLEGADLQLLSKRLELLP